MKIINVPTVTSGEILDEWDIQVSGCCGIDNNYIILDLSEDRVEELKEDIEWQKGKCDSAYLRRLQTELALIENFRNIGYTDSILVCVS